jgi:ubiquinone/menaquinone biosynthesis C-methylase UbiE
MTRDVKYHWEKTAEYFQDEIDLDVGVNWTDFGLEMQMFDSVEGRDILEIGCGGGQCSVALAKRGGTVTGMDITRAQLDYARELAADHDVDISLIEGDITEIPLADESFDIVFNAWVFGWIEDLESCFRETSRVLRPGCRFVFSIPHPLYEIVDPETQTIEHSYFDTGRTDHDQPLYRHTVSGVYNALVEAGFDVVELLEPGTDDPSDYEEGPWDEYTPELMAKVPQVMVVDARKPTGAG